MKDYFTPNQTLEKLFSARKNFFLNFYMETNTPSVIGQDALLSFMLYHLVLKQIWKLSQLSAYVHSQTDHGPIEKEQWLVIFYLRA